MNKTYLNKKKPNKGVSMEIRPTDHRVLNDKGNILIICVVILMILTSLGIFALNSTTVELTMAGRERQENINFQNAEAGMRFAKINFMDIYENTDSNGNPIYTTDPTISQPTPPNPPQNGPGFGSIVSLSIVNNFAIFAAATSGINKVPDGINIPLRDMLPGTGAVAFQYNNQNNIPVALIEIREILRFDAANPTAKDITVVDPRTTSVANRFGLLSFKANDIPNYSILGPAPVNYDDKYYGRNYQITSTALTPTGVLTNTSVQIGSVVPILKEKATMLLNR